MRRLGHGEERVVLKNEKTTRQRDTVCVVDIVGSGEVGKLNNKIIIINDYLKKT